MKITIFYKQYDINLEKLYLSNNQLQTLSAKISNFCNLKELYLCNNQLQTFPTKICNLI